MIGVSQTDARLFKVSQVTVTVSRTTRRATVSAQTTVPLRVRSALRNSRCRRRLLSHLSVARSAGVLQKTTERKRVGQSARDCFKVHSLARYACECDLLERAKTQTKNELQNCRRTGTPGDA